MSCPLCHKQAPASRTAVKVMVDGELATLVLPAKLYEKLAAVAKEEYEKSDAGLRNNAEVLECYGDLLAESDHPIYKDEHGTIRWVPNRLIRWLTDAYRGTEPYGGILNHMAVAYQQGLFSLSEYKEFYREIGYSLSGFSEIFHDK